MTDFPQYWWAEPGRKVVCVKQGAWTWEHADTESVYPRYGDELTIRSVESDQDGVFLRFAEIVNGLNRRDDDGSLAEPEFHISSFRPLFPEKRDTDIAQFTHLLNTAPKRAEVNA